MKSNFPMVEISCRPKIICFFFQLKNWEKNMDPKRSMVIIKHVNIVILFLAAWICVLEIINK